MRPLFPLNEIILVVSVEKNRVVWIVKWMVTSRLIKSSKCSDFCANVTSPAGVYGFRISGAKRERENLR